MRVFSRFAEHSTDNARRFTRRINRLATQWGGFRDRLYEGMVGSLYLPDFQLTQAAQEQHEAVVDARL